LLDQANLLKLSIGESVLLEVPVPEPGRGGGPGKSGISGNGYQITVTS